VLPHVAVKALVDLKAVDACVAALDGPHRRGALWALRLMHEPGAVQGLMDRFASSGSDGARVGILNALVRLYHKEAPYDGSWWWGTRPDTRGPYYKLAKWDESDRIEAFVRKAWDDGDAMTRRAIAQAVTKHRVGFKGIDAVIAARTEIKPADPTVDLEKIASKKGQVGRMSIEDVMLTLKKIKGDPGVGARLFTQQGCVACHTTEKGQALKGPFMGQVGAILSPEQIAESILKPNASISQGFATVQVQTRDGKSVVGFVTAESAEELELRDILGKATRIKTSRVKSRKELDMSMMPPGLANALSLEEFASLIAYLADQKG
jgi:putative heme-binding domain-containing protein